jgi:lysophospholipase L1-like esterase
MVFGRDLTLFVAAVASLAAQDGFYLHDGDRVVFYGDSITDQRLYTTFTETFVVTRFPQEHFTFTHSGWGGDRVSGGGGGPVDTRLERDVFPYKPTVMTIMLGMNDGGYKAFDQTLFDTYAAGYQHIIEAVKSRFMNIRITAIEPSPYDDVTQTPKFEGGYNAVLLRYSDFVKQLAAKDHIDIADLNRPVVADLQKAFATDPEGAKKLIPDRVHPGPAGHLIMAGALLMAWHAPSIVSDQTIDVAKSGMKWTATEPALPMPIDWNDASVRLAVQSSNFLDALDREMLRVNGLKPGNWTLKIDGNEICTKSAEDWARSVNLAQFNTPMMQQAMKVHELTRKHADLHNTRWRNIQVPLAADYIPGTDEALALLDKLDAEVVNAQHKAAQPVEHTYELVAK